MVKKFVYALSAIELFLFAVSIPAIGPQMMKIGGNRFLLGILASAQCLIQFLLGPIFGSWSDSVGAKKALLVSAYGLFVGQLVFAIPMLYCFVIGRVVNASFVHGQILVRTLLSEARESDQAGVQGKIRALGALCFTVAPIIGGIITAHEEGFYRLSLLCCTLAFINIVVCHMLPNGNGTPAVDSKQATPKGGAFQQIFDNLAQVDWRVFGTLFALRFIVETAASIYHQSLGFVFSDVFQCTPKQVGLIVSFYGVCSIMVNVRIKALRKHISNGYVFGAIGMLASFAIIYVFPYFWSYILFIVLFCVFKTLLEATWTDSILAMTDEKNNGAVNGAFQSLVQLAGFFAPLMNGYMGEVYGHSATILLCVALGVVGVGVAMRMNKPKVD